jgi:hypothetical protein
MKGKLFVLRCSVAAYAYVKTCDETKTTGDQPKRKFLGAANYGDIVLCLSKTPQTYEKYMKKIEFLHPEFGECYIIFLSHRDHLPVLDQL